MVCFISDLEKSKKAILAARLALEKSSIGVSLEEKPPGDAATTDPINADNNNSESSNNDGKSENVLPDKDVDQKGDAKDNYDMADR